MNDGALICPRCSGTMTTYERDGIQIDQCQNCRGIFLDRGELERLIQAEQNYYAQPPPPPPPQPAYPPQGYPRTGYYDDHDYDHGHHGHHGRRGFMGGLFD